RYLDMNQSDLASALGMAPPAITQAIAEQAAKGGIFLLPGEQDIDVTEMLAERSGLPFWQFTGSASASNAEVLRMARVATGREKIVMFEGKYHGHLDDTLIIEKDGACVHEGRGLAKGSLAHARIIQFNDLVALEAALAPGDVACVIAEPMLTNCNIVLPDDGFWEAARTLCHDMGTLLVIDEAHTFAFGYGGLVSEWSIKPDVQVLGKGLGSGFPFSAYGMTNELGKLCEQYLDRDRKDEAGLMTGGTTYANALAMAVAKAALQNCLRKEDYERTALLGTQLADGLEVLFDKRGLDWSAPRVGGRSGWVMSRSQPRTSREATSSLAPEFTKAKRLFMATRGVWEAISSAGPAASFAHTEDDISHYLDVSDAFLDAIL
ncbi:MAG: aminotransferase class III-fold pyridoxal phosphate-dependent enzyme, partial [Rhodospirillales bacterium]|nr:aminotransferase class III-fold pyridoxal phosphate-dependent enzyme [Rhodospirillales bacterium]